MTHTRDIVPLRLQLTPMQVSEAPPQAIVRAARRSPRARIPVDTSAIAPVRGCELILHPGEAGEILVKLQNLANRTLYIDIHAEGDFPSQWCRIGMEGHTIPAKGQMEAVLYFQIADDFFESSNAIGFRESLKLDYQGQIYVSYAQHNSERSDESPTALPYIESEDFYLYIRPRSLYQEFLPEIYREIDFIGRLLKIFEQAFEPAVQTLDTLWAYLDPLTAPEAMLPFLAYWVGWPLTPSLSLSRQRYLIRQAIELYRWRGTRRGLRLYIHLFTELPLDEDLPEPEKHISIQEVFGRGFIMAETYVGRDAIIGGGQPYHFSVHLRPDGTHQIDERLVHQIIEQEKPAFCTYDLYISSTP